MSWLPSWTGARATPAAADAAPQPLALDSIRCQLLRSLHGCTDRHRVRATDQVMAAGSAVELWLLRGDLFQYLAQDLGQAEAGRRVARLAVLFEGHVPAAPARSTEAMH